VKGIRSPSGCLVLALRGVCRALRPSSVAFPRRSANTGRQRPESPNSNVRGPRSAMSGLRRLQPSGQRKYQPFRLGEPAKSTLSDNRGVCFRAAWFRSGRSLADTRMAGFANAQAFCAYPPFREERTRSHSRWLVGIARSFDRRIDRTMRQEKVPSVF
jgi:hypothetical protein